MPEVSVVIPLYGTRQGRHSLAAVSLAWLRQDVPCEVVVAVAGRFSRPLHPTSTQTAEPRWCAPPQAAGVLRNLAAVVCVEVGCSI